MDLYKDGFFYVTIRIVRDGAKSLALFLFAFLGMLISSFARASDYLLE
jgi:hypothetical protein